jgi:hypothetical protein
MANGNLDLWMRLWQEREVNLAHRDRALAKIPSIARDRRAFLIVSGVCAIQSLVIGALVVALVAR